MPPGESTNRWAGEESDTLLLIKLPSAEVTPNTRLRTPSLSIDTPWIDPRVSNSLRRWKRLRPLSLPPLIRHRPLWQRPPSSPLILVPRESEVRLATSARAATPEITKSRGKSASRFMGVLPRPSTSDAPYEHETTLRQILQRN